MRCREQHLARGHVMAAAKGAELCKAKSQRQSGALTSWTQLSWVGDEGSGSCWCSEGLYIIAREETCFLAHDAFTPSIRVPPCDIDEGTRLKGELVVLLSCVRVDGQHFIQVALRDT